MLQEIKEFFLKKRIAYVSEVSLSLGIEVTAVEPMLSHWLRKGKLRASNSFQHSQCTLCPGCEKSGCLYEWVE